MIVILLVLTSFFPDSPVTLTSESIWGHGRRRKMKSALFGFYKRKRTVHDIQGQKAETAHSMMFHNRDVVYGMALIIFPHKHIKWS